MTITVTNGRFNRLIEIDDFMASLWKVHLAVKAEGYAQVGTMNIYMDNCSWY